MLFKLAWNFSIDVSCLAQKAYQFNYGTNLTNQLLLHSEAAAITPIA
jgi:hypothetical protein